MAHAGIDYGRGLTNIDHETGIRYGCISQHEVTQAWTDSAEADYGKPTCPSCGEEIGYSNDAPDCPEAEEEWFTGKDFVCFTCKACYWSDAVYADEPLGWSLDDGEYVAVDCLDSDILIIKSPYFTYGPYCSPCVPGAVSLAVDGEYGPETGAKAYCFGHDWFDDGKAPYAVYRVDDGSEVRAEVQS